MSVFPIKEKIKTVFVPNPTYPTIQINQDISSK